jgi:hypothetical protein
MDRQFILKLMFGEVGSDEDEELVRGVLLDNVEFIQVNVGKNFELILLETEALELELGGETVDGLGH